MQNNLQNNLLKNKSFIFLLSTIFFSILNIFFSNSIVKFLASGGIFHCKIFSLVYLENTGAAFSMFENSVLWLAVFSILASLLILSVVLKNIKKLNYFEITGVVIFLSGIFGNMYERISIGFVRDYFHLNFVNFPVFNVSDILVNVGVFVILISLLVEKKTD